MLVLTRRPSESIIIANNIKITVVSVGPGRVKLGIEAPANVRVDRQEIHDKIEQATDVLAAVVGKETATDAQNTLIGTGPDTARILSTSSAATSTAAVPAGTPQAAGTTGAPDVTTGATTGATSSNPTPAPLGMNKLNKYRVPRKPR
jgi:carbon storage regulator